jgi:rod shape-determining protein MreC
MFTGTTNQITGKINQQYNSVEDYFHLRKTNDSLLTALEKLYNKLKENYALPDTASITKINSLQTDSLEQYRKYNYLSAIVVANSVVAQNNYVVLSRGNTQAIKTGMGVIDSNNGVVGITTEVTSGFSAVMSLLHKDTKISGKLLKTGETGTVLWDGKTPNIVSFTGIPKSVKINKGDTVITSGFSTSFPKGLLIGYVEEVIPEKNTSNYSIKLKTAANFYNLQYAFVIDNKQQQEINNLLDKVKKQNN